MQKKNGVLLTDAVGFVSETQDAASRALLAASDSRMAPRSFQVRFLGHRTSTDERGASFTLFHISVVADGLAWEVERRFSEFKKLAEQLKQQAIAQVCALTTAPRTTCACVWLVGYARRRPPGDTLGLRPVGLPCLLAHMNSEPQAAGGRDLPALPPALPSAILNPGFMTSSLNKEFVERRAAGLQEYVQALTRHAGANLGQLADFLSAATEPPAEPWSLSEPGAVMCEGGATPTERDVAREGGATASEDG